MSGAPHRTPPPLKREFRRASRFEWGKEMANISDNSKSL